MPICSAQTRMAFAVKEQRSGGWSMTPSSPQQFAEHVKQRAIKLAEQSDRPFNAEGVALTPLKRNER